MLGYTGKKRFGNTPSLHLVGFRCFPYSQLNIENDTCRPTVRVQACNPLLYYFNIRYYALEQEKY